MATLGSVPVQCTQVSHFCLYVLEEKLGWFDSVIYFLFVFCFYWF